MSNPKNPLFTIKEIGGFLLVSDFEARTGVLHIVDGGQELANKVAELLNNGTLAQLVEGRENARRQRNELQRELNKIVTNNYVERNALKAEIRELKGLLAEVSACLSNKATSIYAKSLVQRADAMVATSKRAKRLSEKAAYVVKKAKGGQP